MFLCIDCGLTNGKLLLFEPDGRLLAKKVFATPLHADRVDTNALNENLCRAVTAILSETGDAAEKISCISVSGHGNGLYALDEDGALPFGFSSMLTQQAERLPAQEQLFPIVLQSRWPGQPLCILAWLKQTDPALYHRIRSVLFCKDLLRYFMTGSVCTEPTDASAAGLLNAQTGQYDRALLQMYGLEDAWEKLPPIRASAGPAGYVSEAFSRRTGLPAGIPVLGGLFDVNSCMLGAGVVDASRFSMTAGTWGINAIPSAVPVRSETITQCCRFYGDVPYVCIDSAPTSCANLEWFARQILQTDQFSQLSEVVQQTPVDEALLYLPYLYAPMDLPQIRGGFLGVQPQHTRADLTRAVFEGIVFEHRRRMEKLQAAGLDADRIVLSGGAANSAVFAQLFADVCGKTVLIPAQTEAGAMGGVILCQMAAGAYTSIASAADALVSYHQPFLPMPQIAYERKYQRFCSTLQNSACCEKESF